jgi:hypothetical protein
MDRITGEARCLQAQLKVIGTYLDLIAEGIGVAEGHIAVTEMNEKRLILGGENSFSEPGNFFGEFVRFRQTPNEPALNISYPVGGYWPGMDAFCGQPSLPARFFSLDPGGNEKRSAGLYLVGHTRGYYGQTNDLPERMRAYAAENGLRFSGPVYCSYLHDEISITDPEQYLAQIAAAVTETRRGVPLCRRRS